MQNRATGQYLSTNTNTGANASVNLLCHQRTQVTQKKYHKPKGNQKCSQSNQQQQSSQPSKKSCPPCKDNKGKQNFKSKGDCTWCGDFKHKDNFRCPASRHKCKICSKVGYFPKMCFFKDKKQQCIQLVQAHDDQTATLQLSDESFHDANEEYMPSDDDFVHNYMVHVYKTSLQQKSGKSSKFQWIKHFVKVKLKPYHTHAMYMHAYVNTRADVNLMLWDMYIKLYNDDKLKHLKPSDIKLGVWGDDQSALLSKCNIYLVHPDTKKPVKVTFYVADKSGSTLLSCATSLKLDLIKLWPRLGVPPPRVKIITSQADRASLTTNWVTKGKVMFDEMTKSASTTSTMMDCTTSGEKGQLWEAPAHLLLVIQTSAIPCFNHHDEIYPSGYINQPKSDAWLQIGHPTLASQKIGYMTLWKK